MDITSLLNRQLLTIQNSEQHKNGKAESVKNIDLSKEHKKVAEEMESLFAYQLIKTMRESATALTADKKSNENDTYMSMFDIEISKLFAKRGMGLQESIMNWLERMPASINTNKKADNND